MQINGVSAAQSGATAPTAATAGSPTPASNASNPGLTMSGTATAGMSGLTEILSDYSTAEVLLALMIMAASSKDEDSGSTAMAFLAGMAMGGQSDASVQFQWSADLSFGSGEAGGQMDLSV